MYDVDRCVIDAKRVGSDLRHRRLDALADGGDAGDDLDLAVALYIDTHGVGRPESAFLDEHGNAGADLFARRATFLQFGLKRRPVRQRKRLVEQQRIIAGVIDNMRAERVEMQIVRHLGLGDQIAAADLDAVDADMRGDRIHQPLAHEGRLVTPRRAISAAWRLVGQANVADGAIGRHAIRARQHGSGKIGHGRRMRAHIGAVVVKEFVVDGEDVTFGIDGGADIVLLLA